MADTSQLNILKDLLRSKKGSLLLYAQMTPSDILEKFNKDVRMGIHLAEKFKNECVTNHHDKPQISLLYISLDRHNAMILFEEIVREYNGERLMTFFHWITCHLAPYILREYSQKLSLEGESVEEIINSWKKLDSISFYYNLDKSFQDLILDEYCKFDTFYSDDNNYAKTKILGYLLGI